MEPSSQLDKSWMHLRFPDPKFVIGVNKFVEFAGNDDLHKVFMPCPCSRCRNLGAAINHDSVKEHCYRHGFDTTYNVWYLHGERSGDNQYAEVGSNIQPSNYNAEDMNAAFNTVVEGFSAENLDTVLEPGRSQEDYIQDVNFTSNLREAMSELYPGCTKFTVLRFVVKLFNLKITHGVTNQFFTELLQLLQMAFPLGNKVPENTYRADKIILDLGLTYKKIHACRNDCILYWGQHEHKSSCPTCGASRYKNLSIDDRKKNQVKTPAKMLCYFPITDRLRRLYSVEWVAKAMCWHETGKSKPGKMGHPVDSGVWQLIDSLYPDFSVEPRNVRLGLATDGFNPFSNLSTSYSSWPMMCVMYNLPPWLCMKPQFTMLCGLIEGPREPGKDICVFMQPLVEELNELWRKGVMVKDAFKGDDFPMRAVLLWTIHDFPAYGNISGCKTKGRFACPPCGLNTASKWLKFGKKFSFMRHRRWLSLRDEIRNDTRESTFDMTEERDPQPLRLTGVEADNMTRNLKMQWGKGKNAIRSVTESDEEDNTSDSCFFKRSKLWDLDYWKDIPIRHNLDVMHIERNVCEILLLLMLNIKKKTKDNPNARKDLKHMKIKKKLWVFEKDGKNVMRPCILWLQKEEKKLFLQILRNLRVPVGFSSNWSRIVKGDKLDLKAMKTHDYHIIMQHLFPILIQHAYKDGIRKEARSIILSIFTFFGALCSRTIDIETLNILERGMVKTLVALERVCPPSLFVVMMHLPIHLAYEARQCGPVWPRWMYTFERMMQEYKAYVSNKAHPEGCIAERYLREETLVYCTGYKGGGGILEKLDRKAENESPILSDMFDSLGENPNSNEDGPVGVSQDYKLDFNEFTQVRNWVLKSHPSYENWHAKYTRYVEGIRASARRNRAPIIEEFIPWLNKQNEFMETNDNEFKDILRGPTQFVIKYNKYCVNGYLFITNDYQKNSCNENSGVNVNCLTTFRSSARDKNPIEDYTEYYGVLRKIIQVEYREGYKPVLFKCDWVKCTPQGVKLDKEANLRLVNLSNLLGSDDRGDEPFILAEHASQVFYSKDPKSAEWHVVLEVPRKIYSDHDETSLVTDYRVVTQSDIGPSVVGQAIESELIFNDDEELFEVVETSRSRKRKRSRK